MGSGNFDAVQRISPGLAIACLLGAFSGIRASAAPPSFDADIQPILAGRCMTCHSAKARMGGLSLETAESVLTGGKSGPAVLPRRPADSLLLTMVANGTMPKGGPKLSSEQVTTIRYWIESGAGNAGQPGATAEPPVAARDVVMAIFGAKCFVCHGRQQQRGGLDLRTVASALKGGKSGPAIIPGKPDESLLVQKIASQAMPPPKLQEQYSVRGVTSDELDRIRNWIVAGAQPDAEAPDGSSQESLIKAEDRQFWSFRPPSLPAVPQVTHQALIRNPIDAFLLNKLEAKQLAFSQEAPRLSLLRRVYLDLTGLPPSPDAVENYLADTKPGAYERMVERLLDSSAYGERWARYWLEAAGYADSEGGNGGDNVRPHAWRYRDYVIRSFNSDKPYNQFLTEQLAGDELFDYKAAAEYTAQQADDLIATGFLRLAPDPTHSTEQNYLPERFDVVANEIEILSSSVLGLTVGCARCHDHKFDPIPQRDYARLSAVLETAYDPFDWRIPNMKGGGVGFKLDKSMVRLLPMKSEQERQEASRTNAPIEKEIEKLKKEIAGKVGPYRARLLDEKLAALPENVRRDLRAALDLPAENRSDVQQYLIQNFDSVIQISDKDVERRFDDLKRETTPIRKQIQAQEDKLVPDPSIRALFDVGGEPTPNYQLRRGNVQTPGPLVKPGALAVLEDGLEPYEVKKPRFSTDTSGRRLALARWLVQPNHPLTARVMVNRIWQHHFGKGLVESPGNFGRTGAPPSHPELLDWLATEFVRQGWSLKAMHRLIVTSAAYRQSAQAGQEQRERDPDNTLLSRFPLRRLDGDAVRDSILRIADRLDPKMFGPAAENDVRPDGEVLTKASGRGYRRSIYLLIRRSEPVTMLDSFDAPQLTPNCLRRSLSTVSSQSLELFNGDLIRESARYLAGSIIDEAGSKPSAQVERAYLRVLARPPSEAELQDAETVLAAMTQAWREQLSKEDPAEPKAPKAAWMALTAFCHTLYNSAEFLYVN